MINPEDTLFLIISTGLGLVSFICLWQDSLFGCMSCFILSIAGISAHIRARRKEKKRKQEEELERKSKQ